MPLTKQEFIREVVEMAMARPRRRVNIESFMNQYWPEDWISVEDALPDEICKCLCYFERVTGVGHLIDTAEYYPDSNWEGFSEAMWRVTHWQPLPPPPSSNQ